MMMQKSRRQHDSSGGELDVFGATSYFAGLPAGCPGSEPPAADRRLMMIQAEVVVPDHEHLRLQPSGKSKLAALLSFMVSPSSTPRASFRMEPSPSPAAAAVAPANKPLHAAGDEPAKAASASSSSSSSCESSMRLVQGCAGAPHELDLGVATGDRRLQGVRVVRGSGDEERWVVRCSAWGEEGYGSGIGTLDAEPGDSKDEAEEGDEGDWESDSSSDLFDLDLLTTRADLSA